MQEKLEKAYKIIRLNHDLKYFKGKLKELQKNNHLDNFFVEISDPEKREKLFDFKTSFFKKDLLSYIESQIEKIKEEMEQLDI